LRVEGVTWSAQRIPTAVNLGFLDRIRYNNNSNNNKTNNNNYVGLLYRFVYFYKVIRLNNNIYVNKDDKEDVGDNDANDSNDDGGAPRISHALCSCDLKHK
jgi:hypothetical protein